MAIAIVERGVHLLYRGTGGKPTYGISVRASGSAEEVEQRGLRREWDINDYVILNTDSWQDTLGLTDAEVMKIRHEIVCAILRDQRK